MEAALDVSLAVEAITERRVAEAALGVSPQAVEAITDHPMVVVAAPPEAEKAGIVKSFHPVGPPRVLTGHVLQRALIFCLTWLRADKFISSDRPNAPDQCS